MVIPSAGSIVIISFPFSDLSKSKLRPALVLAYVDNDDWILAQITSKPYADKRAIQLEKLDFETGELNVTSYVRPGKLFTANSKLFLGEAGVLKSKKFYEVISGVVKMIKGD